MAYRLKVDGRVAAMGEQVILADQPSAGINFRHGSFLGLTALFRSTAWAVCNPLLAVQRSGNQIFSRSRIMLRCAPDTVFVVLAVPTRPSVVNAASCMSNGFQQAW